MTPEQYLRQDGGCPTSGPGRSRKMETSNRQPKSHLFGRGFLSGWLAAILIAATVSARPLASSRPTAQSRSQSDGRWQNPQASSEELPLRLGQRLTKELASGETHSYQIELPPNQYVRIEVRQMGIDVLLALIGTDGNEVTRADRRRGTEGSETLSLLADIHEHYRLEVRPTDAKGAHGFYELTVAEVRAPTPEDSDRLRAERSTSKGERFYQQGTAESYKEAIRSFEDALAAWQRVGDRAGQAYVLFGMGAVYSLQGNKVRALELYAEALPIWKELRDTAWEGETLNNMGSAYAAVGKAEQAIESLKQALPLRHAAKDPAGEAQTLSNIGAIYLQIGENEKALGFFQQALPLKRAAGDRRGEANTLSNIGFLYDSIDEKQAALDYYAQALPIRREVGDRRGEGITLHNISGVYRDLGEYDQALEYLNQARELLHSAGDQRGEARTVQNIGIVQSSLGELLEALKNYKAAATILHELRDPTGEAAALNGQGLVLTTQNNLQEALEVLNHALILARQVKDPRIEAQTLHHLGRVYRSVSEPLKAMDHYAQALTIFQAIQDRRGQASALYGIARLESDRGNLREALSRVESALHLVEEIWTSVGREDLRATYQASLQDYYDLQIDLLMRLHRQNPSAGYAGKALGINERAQARALLDLLAEAHVNVRQDTDAQLIARERRLQRQINAKADGQVRLLSAQHTEQQASAIEGQLRALLDEYGSLRSEIRRQSSRYASLTQPMPLDAGGIQSRVADSDSLLLEYRLGGEHSYLWAVSRLSIKSYELPKRSDVEPEIRQVYDLLTERSRVIDGESPADHRARVARSDAEFYRKAAELSQLLLGPVAQELGARRLVIVAQGPLQYVPFLALPEPDEKRAGMNRSVRTPKGATNLADRHGAYHPLILKHEIVYLPSASTIALLRQEVKTRKPDPLKVAVLADPVFSVEDERFKAGTIPAESRSIRSEEAAKDGERLGDLKRAVNASNEADLGKVFPRLLESRWEAEAILANVPSQDGFKAVDFAANRALVRSGKLSEYRILHFATHGWIDDHHPLLSGLVLSLVDEHGNAQDGFLRSHELFNLKLPADLVVLSACRTAMGKELRNRA